jgi:sugar phosphate isomerase/epimerase
MRLAFTTLACPGWSVSQIFDAVGRYGYEGLEIRLLDGEVVTGALSATLRQQVRQHSRASKVPIICLDTSVSIAQPDPIARDAQVQDGLAMLALAAEWEAPSIRVFANTPPGTAPADAINSAADCLARLADRGAALGVKVLLETHDVVATGEKVAAVVNNVPNQAAGILWDTLHPYRMGEPSDVTMQRVGERLHHVHIKDGQPPADGGSNWDLTLLGEGQVPVFTILKLLHDHDYAGWLSVEWEKKWHPDIAEPEIALPQHSALLRDYLGTL